MEDRETDHLLVVPDTPERPVIAQKATCRDHYNSNGSTHLPTRPGNNWSICKGGGDGKLVINVKKNCNSVDKLDESCNHTVSRFTASLPSSANGGCSIRRFVNRGESSNLHCENTNDFTRNNTQFGGMRDKHKPDEGEASHPSASGAFRNRRLVRNGCISPSNIYMAKKTPELHNKSGVDVKDKGSVSHSDGQGMDATSKNRSEVKGKSVLTCSLPSTKRDSRNMHPASRNLCEWGEDSGGWMNITRKSGNMGDPLLEICGGNSSRAGESLTGLHDGENVRGCNQDGLTHSTLQVPGYRRSAHSSSNGCKDSYKADGPLMENKQVKRQRKHHPQSVCGSSEVIVIGSSGELSASGLPRRHHCPHLSRPNSSFIEINESPCSVPSRVSDCQDHAHSDYSYAMERQLEEDEILARKIQEQLYNECSPVNEQVDLQVDRALQQAAASSSRPRTISIRRRGSSARAASIMPAHARLGGNPNRRGNQTRAADTTAIRNRESIPTRRIRNQNGPMVLRNRTPSSIVEANMEFWNNEVSLDNMVNMCLEMRMDVLEAMEVTFGDLSDADNELGVGRDFNLNDYEMLLSLDENNHQHRGATARLISTLPESVVQGGDTFVEENCVICLEVPKPGDLIRHLPCLHKFHKHCIDAWLGRKTSCPVCNSSVFLNRSGV